jgi:hypothetical protein
VVDLNAWAAASGAQRDQGGAPRAAGVAGGYR